MSRISDLIHELCPDGVPFLPLGQLIDEQVGGGTPARSKSQYWGGDIPWASVGDVTASYVGIRDTRQSITKEGLLASTTNVARAGYVIVALKISPGEMRVAEVSIAINQDLRAIKLSNILDSRFLVYFSKTIVLRGHGTIVKSIAVDELHRLRIPVPPIEVQREIVRILDQFTQLEAELEAELERRRQQFEHYRNSLMTFTEGGRWTTMGEIFEMRAGNAISALEISRCKNNQANIACYGGGGLRGYVREPNQLHDRVLIGRQGALCGNVSWAAGPFYATEHAVVVSPKVSMNDRWAFHALTALNLNQYASKSAQPGLSVSRLKLVDIYFPERRQQDRNAKNLDLLQALMRETGNGLPAEIAARRKQYEYYRDQLLTFKELPA